MMINDNLSESLNVDAVPSTGSATVRKSTEDKTAREESKEGRLHPSKTEKKTNVNIKKYTPSVGYEIHNELDAARSCTVPDLEPSKKQSNNVNMEKDDQQKNTNVIGTGRTHASGGIRNTFHGVSYQMKLPMLYIIRALKQNCKFQVATEVEEAGKLDDLLFLYEEDEIGFFQAKHKLNDDLKITQDQLLSTDGDFSISKYYHSYNHILNEKQLGNVLNDRDIVLIINTNIGIDKSVLKSFERITDSSILSGNKILALASIKEREGYYVLKKESDLYNDLARLLEELEQPSSRVAVNLAKAVVNNKKKSIKVDELFERYREWLLVNVLELGKEDNKTQTRHFVTFRNSFLSGSKESVLHFRNTFTETYLTKKETGKEITTSVMEDLTGVHFQIPKRFALNKNAKPRQGGGVRKFLDKVVFAVNQPNEVTLGDIIEKEIGEYVGQTARQSIACTYKLYIQDWAKQKEGRYLTNEDVEGQFAVWGQETLNQKRMDDIKKYNCTFEESNEVIKTISHFLNTKSSVNVLCLYNRETLFSKIKVCQALESLTCENLDHKFMICDIKDLIELENTKKCPVKAFSSHTFKTLFVSLQGCILNKDEVKMLNQLLKILIEFNANAEQPHANKQRKHLIVNIPEEQKSKFMKEFCFEDYGIKSLSLNDFDNTFSELDEKSRRHLMENGQINLHGNYITSLLLENELAPYMRNEMLLKFVSNELEINDALLDTNQYNEEVNQYYIHRSLLPVIVSHSITKDKRFHFIREDSPQTNIKTEEVVVVSKKGELFEHFRKIYIDVHWLRETNNTYIWITSQGSLTNLRQYVAEQGPDRNSKSDSNAAVKSNQSGVLIFDSDTKLRVDCNLFHHSNSSMVLESDRDSDCHTILNSDLKSDSSLNSDLSSNGDSDFYLSLDSVSASDTNSDLDFDFGSDFDLYPDSDFDFDSEHENYIPVKNVSDMQNDLVLISASHGMGKSILLSHIAEQSKRENNSFFVFKTNLAGNVKQLDRLKNEETVTLNQAIHFVFITTQIESPQNEESESVFNLLTVREDGSIAFSPNPRFDPLDHLRAMVFCNLYNKEKIVLLLDGFDEIAPDYCKTTINLLQTLKHSKVRKMWVTTRPYGLTKDLEIVLETFPYTLKPLSKNDQLKFFKKFWRHKIKPRPNDATLSSLKMFFKSLNMSTLSAINEVERKQNKNKSSPSFMSVPLHSYMLAKLLQNDFIKFCSQNNDDVSCFTPFTIFDLYSNFFDIKFDEILYKIDILAPQNKPFREIKKIAETDHGKLALLEMFDENLLTELVPEEDRIKLINSVKNGDEKIGIVAEVVDTKPRFVHRTYAEYFAGHYLASILLSTVENEIKKAAKSLLYNSVTGNSEYYYVLFAFFNYKVVSKSKNKDIFEAVISGNVERVLENEHFTDIFDPLNRTPTHFIVMYISDVYFKLCCNNVYLDFAKLTKIKMVYNFFQRLEHSIRNSSPDTLFRWMPTHYSTISPLARKNIINPLLSQNFNDVTQDILGRTPVMLFSINNNIFEDDSLLSIGLTGVNIQDNFLRTALHYALKKFKNSVSSFKRSRNLNTKYFLRRTLRFICFLLKNGARIDIPDSQGIMPVDMINSVVNKETKPIIEQLSEYEKQKIDYYDCDDIYLTSLNYIIEHVEKHGYNIFSFEVDDVNTPDHMGWTALYYAVNRNVCDAGSNLINKSLPWLHYLFGRRKRHINSNIKPLLIYKVLRQLFHDYQEPNLSISLCNFFSLLILNITDLPKNEPDICIEIIDMMKLSTDNDEHKNIIVTILINAKLAPIFILTYPHFVDTVDSNGKTALHYAVKGEKHALVNLLIQHNARYDIPDNRGRMPSHIQKGNILNYGDTSDFSTFIFIEHLPFEVATPLVLTMNLYPTLTQIDADFIVYVLLNTKTISRVLLSHYPDTVNTKDFKGRTALHYAIEKKDQKAVCLLISNNAQADIADNDGKYPAHLKKVNRGKKAFHNSNLNDNMNMVNFIESLPFDVAKPLVLTMLTQIDADFIVDVLLDTKTIQCVLLSHYPDIVNTRDSKGRTALHYAVKNEDKSTVCLLINNNAQADIADNDGKYPAHLKKYNQGNQELQKTHVDRNRNVLSFIDTLPFDVAKSLILTMKLLPSLTPSDQVTLNCIFNKLHTVASVLWTEYSDLLKTSTLKNIYLDCTKISNEVICILLKMYYVEDFSHNAVKSNDILKLIMELLSSAKNNDWPRMLTVLRSVEYSAVRPNLANVNLLTNEINVASFVVNARSKDGGKTALHYVAEIGNVDMARCLLSHGAWYNVPDLYGSSPTQIAKEHANKDVLHLLEKVKMLFISFYGRAYNIAKSILMKKEIDGSLFHCICFDTKLPLKHLGLKNKIFTKNMWLFQLFIGCYHFKADFFDEFDNMIFYRERFYTTIDEMNLNETELSDADLQRMLELCWPSAIVTR